MMIVLEGDGMMKLIGVFVQELSSLVEFSWVSQTPSSEFLWLFLGLLLQFLLLLFLLIILRLALFFHVLK